MKKFFYFLMAAAAMTLYACNNDDEKSKINTVTINVLIDNEKVSDAVDVTLTSKSSSNHRWRCNVQRCCGSLRSYRYPVQRICDIQWRQFIGDGD